MFSMVLGNLCERVIDYQRSCDLQVENHCSGCWIIYMRVWLYFSLYFTFQKIESQVSLLGLEQLCSWGWLNLSSCISSWVLDYRLCFCTTEVSYMLGQLSYICSPNNKILIKVGAQSCLFEDIWSLCKNKNSFNDGKFKWLKPVLNCLTNLVHEAYIQLLFKR